MSGGQADVWGFALCAWIPWMLQTFALAWEGEPKSLRLKECTEHNLWSWSLFCTFAAGIWTRRLEQFVVSSFIHISNHHDCSVLALSQCQSLAFACVSPFLDCPYRLPQSILSAQDSTTLLMWWWHTRLGEIPLRNCGACLLVTFRMPNVKCHGHRTVEPVQDRLVVGNFVIFCSFVRLAGFEGGWNIKLHWFTRQYHFDKPQLPSFPSTLPHAVVLAGGWLGFILWVYQHLQSWAYFKAFELCNEHPIEFAKTCARRPLQRPWDDWFNHA